MTEGQTLPALKAVELAKILLSKGDRQGARRWAQRAISMAPEMEEPWLTLAALSEPEASVFYLQRALDINPASERARKGMHWAAKRLRSAPPVRRQPTRPSNQQAIFPGISSPSTVPGLPPQIVGVHRRPVLLWVVLALALCGILVLWGTAFPLGRAQAQQDFSAPRALAALIKPSFTPTATPTFTPTFTPTLTFTPTITPTPTDTPTSTPTDTPTPLPTNTPLPTRTPQPPQAPPEAGVTLPHGVNEGDRWIDVDLRHQRTYAYEGTTRVKSFLVSTGTWLHPTVTGQFHVYVKYRYADMAGPGYYLPDVPYVMYFYQGYGLHGTYWHHNFGTPMSHGCVNLSTPDAGWLFNWASVGTLVNVHN